MLSGYAQGVYELFVKGVMVRYGDAEGRRGSYTFQLIEYCYIP